MSQDLDQASFLRKRKEEILAQKKAAETIPSSSSAPQKLPFANDGSFLEMFKAMQEQQQQVKEEPKEEIKSPSSYSLKSTQDITATKTRTEFYQEQPPSVSIKKEEIQVNADRTTDSYELARELAEKVTKEGVQAEMMARIEGRTDPQYEFLFDSSSPIAIFYRSHLENLKRETASDFKYQKQKRRWDDSCPGSTIATISAINPPCSSLSSNSQQQQQSSETPAAGFMSEFEKAKALVRAKAAAMISGGTGPAAMANVVSEEEKRREKEINEQKMMNEIYAKVIQQQMAAANEVTRKRKRALDKPKFEYDSDEDTEGGTWEHKKRQLEMQKTAEHALELTDGAKGKHHLSDFLPPDELEKFLEKVKAVKEGREADFSDYAKYKIGEDNIGFKMLMKAGWQEGTGLGSKGEGIVKPINKGKTSFDHGGLGTEKAAEVKKEDDDFDVYRKRMMLAYKFRPNPLNNPRRPYYS